MQSLLNGADGSRQRGAGAFVGRERELAALGEVLDASISGRGQLVLVAGEPGIGKSRLAQEMAQRASGRNMLVLWGRCWEAGGAPAYWPWVQLLRVHVRRSAPDVLAGQLG